MRTKIWADIDECRRTGERMGVERYVMSPLNSPQGSEQEEEDEQMEEDKKGEGEGKKQKLKIRKKGEGISQNEKEKIKGIQEGMVSKTIMKKTGKEKEDRVEAERERVRKKLQAKIEGQAAEEEALTREDAGKGEKIRRQQLKDAEEFERAAGDAAIKEQEQKTSQRQGNNASTAQRKKD